MVGGRGHYRRCVSWLCACWASQKEISEAAPSQLAAGDSLLGQEELGTGPLLAAVRDAGLGPGPDCSYGAGSFHRFVRTYKTLEVAVKAEAPRLRTE